MKVSTTTYLFTYNAIYIKDIRSHNICKKNLNITAEPPHFRNVSNRSTYPRIQHTIMHNIPHGWRVASSSDVGRFPKQAQKEISTNTKDHTKLWVISALSDGRIHGKGYGYKVDHQMLPCAEKLLIKGGTYNS